MCHYLFFIAMCLILQLLAGCSTSPMYGGRQYGYGRGYGGGMFLRGPAVPVPPSNAAFLYRPSMYCEEGSPLCLRITNNLRNEHGHCWIDGREARAVAWGGTLTVWVRTANSLKQASLLPPGAEAYLQGDTGIHTLKCQRYAGPTQVLPDGSYVFEPLWERTVSGTINSFPTRAGYHEYRIEEGGWDRITRRY